jgi:hypothetical protein
MMNTIDTLKLALEALELDSFYGTKKQEAITAIKQALAAPAQPAPTSGAAKMPCGAVVRNVYDAYEAGKKAAQPAPVQEMTNIQRHEQNVQKFLAAQPAPEKSSETQTASAYVKTYHGGKPWPLQPAPEKGQP